MGEGDLGEAVITQEFIGGSWESKVWKLLIGWAATVSGWAVVGRRVFLELGSKVGNTFLLE